MSLCQCSLAVVAVYSPEQSETCFNAVSAAAAAADHTPHTLLPQDASHGC